jgi:hypothetical protein
VAVRFEILLRRRDGEKGSGVKIVGFDHRFNRDPDPQRKFRAVPFSASAEAGPVDAAPGDRLVLRAIVYDGEPNATYILNGDGQRAGGEIPHIDLPH